MFLKRHSQKIIFLILATAFLWGAGRLYFSMTDGFWMSNIESNLAFSEERVTRPLSAEEKNEAITVLNQPWTYLAKGCQSYVFESADGHYVLKFFKYQRFRPQAWLKALSFLPPVEKHLEAKQAKKDAKLNFFMQAWKVAFDDLKEESGLVMVHLNKSSDLNVDLKLTDKMGFQHSVPADSMEFLIQRKADMLVPWIKEQMKQGHEDKVEVLLDNLVQMFVSEYSRGLSDNDHALMQNTGVYKERPFHIDVGQFTKEERFKDPNVWHQELYNKTYKFRLWLLKTYPEMGEHLTESLKIAIGDDYANMKPYFGRAHD